MRHLFIITILLPLLTAGCTQYARLEEVPIGMPVDEFLQLSTPCYYRATVDDAVQYSCRLSVPYGQAMSRRAVRPYILTFENGVLTQIVFDEHERDRQLMRNHYHYGYGYGYGYRHRYYYGHPFGH